MGKLDTGRCGLCCSLLVRLNSKDIERIKELGYDDFTEIRKDEKILKRVNGYCIFLKIEEGIATCTIYDHRPKVCREYECIPEGYDDCKLKRHYKIVDLDVL